MVVILVKTSKSDCRSHEKVLKKLVTISIKPLIYSCYTDFCQFIQFYSYKLGFYNYKAAKTLKYFFTFTTVNLLILQI
jgi:hypothetical protein